MSVEDAARMMNVLTLPDARDWTSLPFEARDYTVGLHDGVRGLRIAYSPRLGYAKKVHPEIAAAVDAAVREFDSMGAQVEATDPGIDDPLDISIGLWFAGAWTLWNTLTPEQQAVTDPDFRAEAEQGGRLSMLDVQRLHLRRGALGSHMRQFMQRFDLLITPAVAIPAFDARAAGSVRYDDEAMLGWTPFSYPFNLTQQPACTIPCGLTSDGLPIGLQMVGPMFGDAPVLRAARAYESTRPIPRPRLN
jgi:aspartyl-tRNA(Asn)/glutamyl-tRNA(Gln) amidotransferase subunit A